MASTEDLPTLVDWEKQSSIYYEEGHYRWRAHCKAFVDAEIMPYIDKWEKNQKVPEEFFKKCVDAGMYTTPYGFGPRFENQQWDQFYEWIFYEQVMRAASGGLITNVWIHNIAVPPVLHFGTPEQKRKMDAVIRADQFSCLAISEMQAGSDVANITTTARRDGDHYVVNGNKYWISGGMKADYFVTAVRTGGPSRKGISLLLIERGPGVYTAKLKLQGHATSDTATVTFVNARVPVKNLIGEENKGFRLIMFNFNQERYGISCQALASARVCVDECIKWAQERKTFGVPLIKHQVIRHKIAEMSRKVLATHAFLERVAYQLKTDPLGMKDKSIGINVSLCKVQCTRTLQYCVIEASQIFGGRSYVVGGRGGKIDRIYRDCRAYAIYGGSEEIMLNLAVKQAKL